MRKNDPLLPTVSLTPNIMRTMSSEAYVQVKAGVGSCLAQKALSKSKEPDNILGLNKSAARDLKLPVCSYNIYASNQDQLFIGPIVGVMTSAVRGNCHPRGKTGRLLKELVVYARNRGIFVYLFGFDAITRDRYHLRGLTISHNRWHPGVFVWPDVIYNRIRLRNIEKRPNIVRLLYEIEKDTRVYMFNSRFLNKREVYHALGKHQDTLDNIPETRGFERRNLQTMLAKYPGLFMKPNHGSVGRGIYKIKRISPGRYCFAAASSAVPIWRGPYSMEVLFRNLQSGLNGRKDYLLQQAIDLARYESRLFDVRSQVQKDRRGEWILTGAAVRVAGKNRFVTHIPNGGRAESLEQVVLRVFPAQSTQKSIYKQLEKLAVCIPRVLEETLGINLAILTMDLGIDSTGKMWALEVNSKPSSFDEDDIRMKHLQHLTDYFIYAAGKKNEKGFYET